MGVPESVCRSPPPSPPGRTRRGLSTARRHYHWDHIGDKERGILGLGYFVDREDHPPDPAGGQRASTGVPAYIHESELAAAVERVGVARPERMVGAVGTATGAGQPAHAPLYIFASGKETRLVVEVARAWK
jgi:hypothetical protein